MLEGAGWLILLGTFWFTISTYADLGDEIPTHFDAFGNPNGYSKKVVLFLMPILSAILYASLYILNFYPHTFNYPVRITPENALHQYSTATRMIRSLNLSMVVVFALISWKMVRNAHGLSDYIGVYLLPLILLLVFVPIGYGLVRMGRD